MIGARWYLSLPAGAGIADENGFSQRESQFLERIRVANGSHKTTHHNRLKAVDDLFFEVIARRNLRPRTVMDIGVSSGVTTVDWLREFERRGLQVQMIATDLTINVYFVTIAPFIDVLVDVNGHILEFQVFTRAVRPWIGGRREYISGAAYLKAALKWLGQRRLKKLGIAFPIRGQQSKPIDGPYQLVTPALRGRKNVVLREENILQPAGGDRAVTADVIRLGNIMQTVYFSPQQMRTIARHIVERCRGDNGVIVLCRNAPDGDIHASILRMERGGVPKVEARLGCGSEAEQYFLDVGAFAD